MAEPSHLSRAAVTSDDGRSPDAVRITGVQALIDMMRNCKRSAAESSIGKGDKWVERLLSGECGVMLDDLPALFKYFEVRLVKHHELTVDPELFAAVMTIHEKAAPQIRKLVLGERE